VTRLKFSLVALLVVGGLGYLVVTGFRQSAATQVTLASLEEKRAGGRLEDERLQLGGCTVVQGSIRWDRYRHRPEFVITDGQRVLPVRYTGSAVLPDTFKDRAQVVLEGRYLAAQNLFDAKVVFAKCPSKYEGQEYQGHVEALDGQAL
jgi:cytochrome c-type biogenesis protein CcmE